MGAPFSIGYSERVPWGRFAGARCHGDGSSVLAAQRRAVGKTMELSPWLPVASCSPITCLFNVDKFTRVFYNEDIATEWSVDMILSTKGRYGLKAMFELGLHHGSGPVPLKVIAEKQRIPENYLEQLIAILRKAGLVRSVRGAQGGYMLMKQPENISVADVLLTLEGPMAPSECVLDSENSSCDNAEKCVTRTVWEKILISIHDVIDTMTLQDMINDHTKINDPNLKKEQEEEQEENEQEMMI